MAKSKIDASLSSLPTCWKPEAWLVVAGAEVGMNEVPITCCSGMFDLGLDNGCFQF